MAPFAFFVTALALTPNHYLTKRSTKRDSLPIPFTFRKASPSILDALGISHSSEAQGLTEICQQSHRQSVVQWKPDLVSLPPGPDSMTPGYVTGHSAQCVSAGNILHFPPVTADELTCRSQTHFYLLIFSPCMKIGGPGKLCLKSADFSLKQIRNPSWLFPPNILYEAPFCLFPKKLITCVLDSYFPSLAFILAQCVLYTDISLKIRNRFMDTLKL